MPKFLPILLVVLALGYGGYWFVGRGIVEGAARDLIEEADAGPLSIRYEALDTVGFPSRFDTTITGVEIAAEGGSWFWAAPFLQVLGHL